MASYPDSVAYLYSLGNEIKSLKFGLESIGAVLESLGNPHHRFRSIHVAGTNGKGSTCAMLESSLRAADVRTGLFTSPHLTEPTERIQINASAVTRAAFVSAFDRVHEAALTLVEGGKVEHHPTYFETVTAMAFLLFADRGVEVAVLETGMGGRLDATNVVTPELCVITRIDLDHQQWLGSTLEEIAGEKAGILKAGVPVVVSRQLPQARAVLLARARELNCPVTAMEDARLEPVALSANGSSFVLDGARYECALPGAHQVENASTAATALRIIGVPIPAIAEGLRSARWPGRLEIVRHSPDVLLDGAHNPGGARALASYLREFHGTRRIIMVFGAMADKAVPEIAATLFPLASLLIVTTPQSPRALRVEQLQALQGAFSSLSEEAVAKALQAALAAARSDDLIVVTGSLYLVGEARSLLVQ